MAGAEIGGVGSVVVVPVLEKLLFEHYKTAAGVGFFFWEVDALQLLECRQRIEVAWALESRDDDDSGDSLCEENSVGITRGNLNSDSPVTVTVCQCLS
jgi:hypothetical protein